MIHIVSMIILMKRCVFHSFVRLGVGKPGGSMPPTSKWFILRRHSECLDEKMCFPQFRAIGRGKLKNIFVFSTV